MKYDVEVFSPWVKNLYKEEFGEIVAVANNFNSKVNEIINLGIWKGTAARKNYQNFMDSTLNIILQVIKGVAIFLVIFSIFGIISVILGAIRFK